MICYPYLIVLRYTAHEREWKLGKILQFSLIAHGKKS